MSQRLKKKSRREKVADEHEIIAIPDSHAPQFAEQQFELRDGDMLVYFKLFTMNNQAIKNRNHDVREAMAEVNGHIVFDDPERIRKFLHELVDNCINDAKKKEE